MAGDWIKMRTALLTHPKVNGIARILEQSVEVGRVLSRGVAQPMSEIVTRNVMRNVTVASLLTLWSNANEHSVGGVIRNADFSYIDDLLEIPGFGDALSVVGWAVYLPDEHSVLLPNFSEYNTCGEERRSSGAERQKRHRDKKRAEKALRDGDVTSDVTSHNREEKRREDIKDKPPTPSGRLGGKKFNPLEIKLPDWMPARLWAEWVAFRTALGKPIKTPAGANGTLNKLERFSATGHKPADVIAQSIANEWQGLFPVQAPRPEFVNIDFIGAFDRLVLHGKEPQNQAETKALKQAQTAGLRRRNEVQAHAAWRGYLSQAYKDTGETPGGD